MLINDIKWILKIKYETRGTLLLFFLEDFKYYC